jgi:hypothetical protein
MYDLDNFKKFFSIKVIKIVLDSMLYETLKWPQIASLQNKIPNPLPLSRIMACTLRHYRLGTENGLPKVD